MFNNISWSEYLTVITVFGLIYYAYVLLVYYRGDLHSRLASNNSLSPAGNFQSMPSSNQALKNAGDNEEELLPAVQSLTDEIMAFLEQAGIAGALKPEIIFALQQISKKYESLKNTSYQNAVNSLLQFECESKCNIHLDEAEMKQVWMG
jgi:hypothetical protein